VKIISFFDKFMAETLNVLNPKVEAVGLIDLAGMLIVKRVVDAAAVPVVGNNNIFSGLSKIAIGGLLHGKGGRLGHIATGGVVLDGVDDLAGVFMSKIGIGGGGSNQTQAVNPGL
jgi:hypothetical protein